MTQALNLALLGNNVNTSGQVSLTAAVSGTLPVGNGGTGAATLAANNVLLGNGTSALQAVAPSTSGNVLTSNGSTWTSAAPPAVAPTTTQVLNATAGASVGAVGTYAFLGPPGNSGYLPGATAAGSGLRYVAAMGYGAIACGSYFATSITSDPRGGGTPAGTWRCMGYGVTTTSGFGTPTLWLRIS